MPRAQHVGKKFKRVEAAEEEHTLAALGCSWLFAIVSLFCGQKLHWKMQMRSPWGIECMAGLGILRLHLLSLQLGSMCTGCPHGEHSGRTVSLMAKESGTAVNRPGIRVEAMVATHSMVNATA